MNRRTVGLVLVAIGMIGILAFPLYSGLVSYSQGGYGFGSGWSFGMLGQWFGTRRTLLPPPVTLDGAKAIAQQYLVSLGNPSLAIEEIMEFQNNFYVVYYEKETGVGAFEMLIWKQASSHGMMGGGMMGGGMMGGRMTTGVIVPEPGPNMMWNTKYGMMRGMMGSRSQAGASSEMRVSEKDVRSIAENYLSQNFPGAHVEGVTRFYGYYTIDFEKDGKIIGMMSVNGYTGQTWYHSWHGAFIQETELD